MMAEIVVQTPRFSGAYNDDTGHDATTALLAHEEAVRNNPTSLSLWLKYLSYLRKAPTDEENYFPKLLVTFERAVSAIPANDKLWREYTHEFRSFARAHHPLHASRSAARSVSKRGAHAVSSSAVLWAELLQHQLADNCLEDARNTLNSALRAVPVTQHEQIWDVILSDYPWKEAPLPAVHLLRRYAKFAPDDAPLPLAKALIAAVRIDDALDVLRTALAQPSWAPRDMSRQDVFLLFVKTAARHAANVRLTPVSDVVNVAVKEAGAPVGELWSILAEFYIRRSDFTQARAVLEHAISSVTVARDFAIAFDAYTKLEESLVEVLASRLEKQRGKMQEKQLEREVAMQLTRLEYLVDRRPMLLSDVQLRQNVHNVHEWHKRMRMLKSTGDHSAVVDGYTRAIRTVDTDRATHGRKHTLWLAFAHYHEQSGDLTSARRTLENALLDEGSFRTPEDVAAVWCEFAEMELRAGDLVRAIKVLRRALSFDTDADRSPRFSTEEEKPTVAVKRSRRIWLFLLDALNCTDDVDDITAAHKRMLDAKVATPSSILHGAVYLEERRLFERAFRLYDRATAALAWPEALQIWVIYLTKFVERYGSKRVERARDLFEEAIRSAPTTKSSGNLIPHSHVKILYVMYAEMEERFSLGRHALAILDRAVRAVREEDRAELYRLYIVKTATLSGVSRTRAIYVEALQTMRDLEAVVEFACRFSAMERRLGEIDRARAVYVECCRVVDTRVGGNFARFWKEWEEFEAEEGNEDDVRNMLRWKRRVQLDHQNVLLDHRSLNSEGMTNMVRGDEIRGSGDADDSKNVTDSDGGNNDDATREETRDVDKGTDDAGDKGDLETALPDRQSSAETQTPANDEEKHAESIEFVRQVDPVVQIQYSAQVSDAQQSAKMPGVTPNGEEAPEDGLAPLSVGVKRLLATAYNNANQESGSSVVNEDAPAQSEEVPAAVDPPKKRKRRWDVEVV